MKIGPPTVRFYSKMNSHLNLPTSMMPLRDSLHSAQESLCFTYGRKEKLSEFYLVSKKQKAGNKIT
jgi:hypothetical protein